MVFDEAVIRLGKKLPGPLKPTKSGAEIAEEQCIARGGRWDGKKCIMPQPTPVEPEPITGPTKLTPQERADAQARGDIIRTDRFGEETIQTSEEARKEAELASAGLGGRGAAAAIQRKEEEALRVQELVSQIGQLGKLDPAIQADINFSQAFTAGIARVVPSAVGAAALGAAAGVVGSAGTLSAPAALVGGAAGAVGGFVSGVLSNIKEQQRGELQAADIELINGRAAMRQFAMLATTDQANADVYIQLYNQAVTRMHQARRQTHAEVQGDLNAWMEDGREQLADFDSFLGPGGLADIYGLKLQTALQTGVPLSINGEELFLDFSKVE